MSRGERLGGCNVLANGDIVSPGSPHTGRIRLIRSRWVRCRVAVHRHWIPDDRRRRALIGIGMLVAYITPAASVTLASDKLTVAVTNREDLTVTAGESVSDGGDGTITNNSSTDTVAITSLTYTPSNPGLFSST